MTSELKPIGIHPDFPESTVFCNELEDFCHTRPYPTDEQLSAYYKSEYREVRNEQPDENYVRFMDERAGIQLDFILEMSGRPNFESALDIGCGAGRLLNALGNKCKHVYGYEPDKAMADFALANRVGTHLQVVHGLFQPEKSPIKTHLITMSHVLEHVPDPAGFLRTLGREALAPRGYLFVEVPNDPERWVRKQLAWKIRGLAHINYFTETSLVNHLAKSGYQVLAIRSCGLSLKRFIRKRKPKSPIARRVGNVLTSLLPERPYTDVYKTSPDSHENIYLQALARIR